MAENRSSTGSGNIFLLNEHDLAVTEKFFGKHGDITILICRFIPVVRHLISIPAGTGRMNLLEILPLYDYRRRTLEHFSYRMRLLPQEKLGNGHGIQQVRRYCRFAYSHRLGRFICRPRTSNEQAAKSPIEKSSGIDVF